MRRIVLAVEIAIRADPDRACWVPGPQHSEVKVELLEITDPVEPLVPEVVAPDRVRFTVGHNKLLEPRPLLVVTANVGLDRLLPSKHVDHHLHPVLFEQRGPPISGRT